MLADFHAALAHASDRDAWLSRKRGLITLLNDNWLRPAPKEFKRSLGARLNALRHATEVHFAAAVAKGDGTLRSAQREARPPEVDVTLPPPDFRAAGAHPVLQVRDEIVDIFLRLGYSVADGPEIETAYYNFEALNIPAGHPAREEQDTLYLDIPGGEYLLRTHTSPVQIHCMERQRPPLRVIVPGKVYRRDAPDASHSPNFQQIEGLAVDEDLTLGDLKGTLERFAQEFFGSGTSIATRLRPSYFQFTEPSAELDVACIFCHGAGCRTCKQTGWIEVLGCGMVDPAVFGNVGYDPERYSGFAFGMGIERLAMLRYGIDDIQRFYSGDIRFLEQFR
ncbi:MAG: phenylalanine--tRNA ligase subunit alpha [Acidobacteria bacterium]|nr:MAG: phenylalanine--tRNA ligase subunit alpha [Acidobacteriota bacterium]